MSKLEERELVEIIDGFDFETVRGVMILLDWKWGNAVPTIKEMKATATELLKDCSGGKYFSCSTGGFVARYNKGENVGEVYYSLEFQLERFSSWGYIRQP